MCTRAWERETETSTEGEGQDGDRRTDRGRNAEPAGALLRAGPALTAGGGCPFSRWPAFPCSNRRAWFMFILVKGCVRAPLLGSGRGRPPETGQVLGAGELA